MVLDSEIPSVYSHSDSQSLDSLINLLLTKYFDRFRQAHTHSQLGTETGCNIVENLMHEFVNFRGTIHLKEKTSEFPLEDSFLLSNSSFLALIFIFKIIRCAQQGITNCEKLSNMPARVIRYLMNQGIQKYNHCVVQSMNGMKVR